MNTVFITRTDEKTDEKDFDDLKDLINQVSSAGIEDSYVVSEGLPKGNKIGGKGVKFVKDKDPISPVAINAVLKKLEKKPDALLICSKEVNLKKNDIGELENTLGSLLVVGYKFQVRDKELKKYYDNKSLIAYRIPWNTCAIWNYPLFEKCVEKFDEITYKNPFPPLRVCIDNKYEETKYRGMEDGLAIAKAASYFKGQKKLFKLLDKQLDWKVTGDKLKHRKKLARKDRVLRNFMAVRDYSVKDLESSEMK